VKLKEKLVEHLGCLTISIFLILFLMMIFGFLYMAIVFLKWINQ